MAYMRDAKGRRLDSFPVAHAENIYNLKPEHLRKTRARLARARAGVGYAKLAFLGDSTIAGAGGPAPLGWPEQLAARLDAAGYPFAGGPVPAIRGAATPDSDWALGAGWTATAGHGTALQNSTTANALVYTSRNAGTIVRVYYGETSGPFTVSIDGATPVAVAAAAGGSPRVAAYEVTGLADTTHIVSIVRTSGTPQIFGAEVRKATFGVLVANLGTGGSQASDAALGPPTHWYFPMPLATGATSQSSAYFGPPDLIVIQCEVNDPVLSVPVATWKASMSTAITNALASGADVVLATAFPFVNAEATYNLSDFTEALYELADEHDVPLVDFVERWESYTIANGLGMFTDTFHPSATGYGDGALAIMRVLGITGGGLPASALPRYVPIEVLLPASRSVGAWTHALHGSALGGAYRLNGGANGDYLEWDLLLLAGSWTLDLNRITGANHGIVTWSLDGVDIGTQDGYSAATVYNVTQTFNFTATSGPHTLRARLNGKNASNTLTPGHYALLSKLSLRRTGP